MQFADLAFRKGEQANIRVPQPLENRGNVFLITTDAIKGLGNDVVKPAALRLAKERLHARSIMDRR